ncbi:hypothetical protein OB905_00760 [Halobacteria archaeon AArc-dxtr1]|nr:hypothetical protein [Halobacteria archaeon AArc-dxtr1]
MSDEHTSIRRRTLLRTAGSAIAVAPAASVTAGAADDSGDRRSLHSWGCPDATTEPSMGDCAGASWGGCADDHPETEALQDAVRETLETEYPDVGALVDAGFKPYFDTLIDGEDGWSHWLHPDHIGDNRVLDPERPESVLVDNGSWRSIGAMFIAVEDGEPVDRPPAVYELDEEDGDSDDRDHDDADSHADNDRDHDDADGDGYDHGDGHDHGNGDEQRCSPWHYHAGLPGRFAWWFYQQTYADDANAGLALPCRTPCMMHVWTVDHPDGVYAHGGPPPENRGRSPAAETGFETSATPGEDELGWDVLPDDLVPDALPDDFR